MIQISLGAMIETLFLSKLSEHLLYVRFCLADMATAWGEILQHLMGAGLLATRGVKEKLESHHDPLSLMN